MENEEICEKHNIPIPKKLVPAGISKRTGRPYKAFYTCEQCNPYGKAKKQYGSQPNAFNEKIDKIIDGERRIIALLEKIEKKL